MHIHAVYFTNVWKNTAITVQMHSRGQGASYGRHACAAASCRRRDLATAGKAEFVKSEPPLMRKNTDPFPARKSQPIGEQAAALGTKTPTEQRRQRRTGVSAHKRQRTEQSRGELTPTLALAGCWVALGWRVCVCVRVFLSAFSLCCLFTMCACVFCRRVRFPFSPRDTECNDKYESD